MMSQLAAVVFPVLLVGISPTEEERRYAQDWVQRVLGTTPVGELPGSHVIFKRQDFGQLQRNRSEQLSPLCLAGKTYAQGFGTHAVSEIEVRLDGPAERFTALAGLDDNEDTRRGVGSVIFEVRVEGKAVWTSPVQRRLDPAAKVDVPLNGAKSFTLLILDAGDGPSHDQADWVEPAVIMRDGRKISLDALPMVDPAGMLEPAIPFTFTLGGQSSREFLGKWNSSDQTMPVPVGVPAKAVRRVFRDPKNQLEVTWDVKWWTDCPAVEWVLTFRNPGQEDSPVLADVLSLDTRFQHGRGEKVALHRLRPCQTTDSDFFPYTTTVAHGKKEDFGSMTGRSSEEAIPFFTVDHGGRGLVVAVGWTGRWRASLERDGEGITRIRSGLGKLAARLRPGESVRSPRMLLCFWEGQADRGYNLFRSVMLAHYGPRTESGGILLPPVAEQSFDLYYGGPASWRTEAGQIDFIRKVARLGVDTYWLDAAWFPKGFPEGVGNWVADPTFFPKGLRPVGDEAHRNGMKFLVWFEPGRVAPNTTLWQEHPQWVLRAPGNSNGVFDFSKAEARQWLSSHILKLMGDYGIDSYREDFNIVPAPHWDAQDKPERIGITENHWITGFYEYWDSLRAARPGMLIDNCASGGRRIDLETCMRSIPLWRSDTGCSPGHADWDQTQFVGLGRYVPLHTIGSHGPQAYNARSAATAGFIAEWDLLNPTFDWDTAIATIREVKRFRQYWLGDLYILASPSQDAGHWQAWHLHREDLNSGIVLAFRRGESPYPVLDVPIRTAKSGTSYQVTFIDEARKERSIEVSGADLIRGLRLEIDRPRASLLVHYQAK